MTIQIYGNAVVGLPEFVSYKISIKYYDIKFLNNM